MVEAHKSGITTLNKKLLTATVHIAAWACFFLLPMVFFPRNDNFPVSNAFVWMFICIDAYLLGFYYLNSQVLIPRFLVNRKWLIYTALVIAALLVFTQIPKLFEDAIRADLPPRIKKIGSGRRRSYLPYPFTGTTALFFLVLMVSTSVRLIQEWLASEEKQAEVEREKLNTELYFLKAQINPHFLFNTLNNIYSLAVVKSDATAPAVMKLSSIMRYVISDTKQHWVPLEKEVKFIQDYIALQQVRLTDKVHIQLNIDGNINDHQIAPLIFIPFVENAFKYGISTKEHSHIDISLQMDATELNFTVDNRIVSIESTAEENTGIGLKNTRRRLEILYPGKHQLNISNDNQHFHVHLKLVK